MLYHLKFISEQRSKLLLKGVAKLNKLATQIDLCKRDIAYDSCI